MLEEQPLINDVTEDRGNNNQFPKMTQLAEAKATRGIFSLLSAKPPSDNTENNWTKNNQETLTTWINNLSQASFIYQYAKESKKTKLNRMSLTSFLLTGLATILGGVSSLALSSDSEPYKSIALGFSIAVFCLNSGSTILNGVISKIYKFDTEVEEYTKYIERIDSVYADLSTEHDLSPDLREDAVSFIKRESKRYIELIQKCPDVEPSLYEEGVKKYHEFLEQVKENNDIV